MKYYSLKEVGTHLSFIGDMFKEFAAQSVKFFAILVISLYYQYITYKRPLPAFRFIKYIAFVLLFRDIIYSIVRVMDSSFQFGIIDSGLFILVISDIIILLLYLYWLREYTGQKKQDFIIILINLFFIILIIVNIFLFGAYGTWYGFAILGIYLITLIYLSVHLIGISVYNTENADVILKTRNAIR